VRNVRGEAAEEPAVPVAIRPAQAGAFRAQALLRFEREMIDHCRAFNPRLCATLSKDELRTAVHEQIAAAEGHGFASKGPIRLCVELMFLFGSRFADDPQYPKLSEILRSGQSEMSRAQDLHEWANDYLDAVSGPRNIHVRRVLDDLAGLASAPFEPVGDVEAAICDALVRIYPEKCEYLGLNAIRLLIAEGLGEANRCGFVEPRRQALMVILMLAFGHGCTNDPLYPWISRVFADAGISDSSARGQRLEKKAVTWLESVLATEPERTS
jgi:hypothetical protein